MKPSAGGVGAAMLVLRGRDAAKFGAALSQAKVGAPRRAAPKRGRAPRIAYPGDALVVSLDLAPQPKERARTFMDERAVISAYTRSGGQVSRFMALIKGGGGEAGVMRSVTPEATREFEATAALMVRQAMAQVSMAPFDCPLEMVKEFRIEGDPATWPTAQSDGDLDNLEKSLADALNRVAYVDDRLIVLVNKIKVCAARPGISLMLRPADPERPSYFDSLLP